MTRILLPTDFSDTAEKAAHFAMDLYGTDDVRYTLVNCYHIQAYPDPLLPNLTLLAAEDSRTGLEEVEGRLRKRADNMHVEKVSLFGSLPEVLNDIAARKGADLIVMGTQGKDSNRLFGRIASNVIKRAQLPTITVPSHWEPEPINRILLPMDGEPFDAATFLPLIDLAKRCGAEVMVAHVRTNAVDFAKGLDHTAIGEALKDVKHRYLTVHGTDVVDTVNELIAGSRFQLVAMVHRKRGFLDGLFHISTAKQMALHTKLPLLVLRHG